VQRFVAKEYSFAAREAIVGSKEGWSREIWAKLAELGLLGLQVPEEQGGMGGASVETMLTMNALGRGLLLEPYLPARILGTALIRDLGSPRRMRSCFRRWRRVNGSSCLLTGNPARATIWPASRPPRRGPATASS